MNVEEATQFFMANWYQGNEPSRQEALRGTFDPGYLFYTLGKLQILKLREDLKKQEGENYSLQKFNNAMLENITTLKIRHKKRRPLSLPGDQPGAWTVSLYRLFT